MEQQSSESLSPSQVEEDLLSQRSGSNDSGRPPLVEVGRQSQRSDDSDRESTTASEGSDGSVVYRRGVPWPVNPDATGRTWFSAVRYLAPDGGLRGQYFHKYTELLEHFLRLYVNLQAVHRFRQHSSGLLGEEDSAQPPTVETVRSWTPGKRKLILDWEPKLNQFVQQWRENREWNWTPSETERDAAVAQFCRFVDQWWAECCPIGEQFGEQFAS